MMIAYNLDYSTCIGKVKALTAAVLDHDERRIEMGALYYDVPDKAFIAVVANKAVTVSPVDVGFVKANVRRGLLPTLVEEVLSTRLLVKASAKLHPSNKKLCRILDARQLALKLIANVIYGYTAACWSGRMPCVDVADSILSKGRETLERALELIRTGNYDGAEVIYGDTDSLFVLCRGANLSKAFEIGRRIATDVTASNPPPVVLKLEKVYMGCVLETKKRYAGMMYENESSKGVLDAKGIETIRRDSIPLVSKILEHCLRLIFTGKEHALALYLKSRLSNLTALPFTDFVFCKEFRGDYDPTAAVPQRKIAEELCERFGPRPAPMHGERVPWLVVEGTGTVYSCVRSPQDWFQANLRPDLAYAYYVRAHLLPALRRVFDLIPLRISWKPPQMKHCYGEGCLILGHRPWCQSCWQVERTFKRALVEDTREQRMKLACRKKCDECVGRSEADIEDCRNLCCPVAEFIRDVRRRRSGWALNTHLFTKEELGESVEFEDVVERDLLYYSSQSYDSNYDDDANDANVEYLNY